MRLAVGGSASRGVRSAGGMGQRGNAARVFGSVLFDWVRGSVRIDWVAEARSRLGFAYFDRWRSACDGVAEQAAGRYGLRFT